MKKKQTPREITDPIRQRQIGVSLGSINPKAIHWFRAAARKGEPYAQLILGNCYIQGHGVPKNYRSAFSWYLKAAKKGVCNGAEFVGDAYAEGRGTAKDLREARKWFLFAEELCTNEEDFEDITYKLRDVESEISDEDSQISQEEFCEWDAEFSTNCGRLIKYYSTIDEEISVLIPLRFDGYKFEQEKRYDGERALRALLADNSIKMSKNKTLYQCFRLQRELLKGDSEGPRFTKKWEVFRSLMLESFDWKIETRYRVKDDYQREQERKFAPYLKEAKEFTRRIHQSLNYHGLAAYVQEYPKGEPADHDWENHMLAERRASNFHAWMGVVMDPLMPDLAAKLEHLVAFWPD